MLIFDGHGSHVTKEVIEFCQEKKIVLLCLPSHSTHLLQPLDVGVFGPLAGAYKRGVLEATRYADCQLNKVEFLDIYSKARSKAISPKNVKSAWQKTGLFPLNPDIVLLRIQEVKLEREAKERAEKERATHMAMLPPPSQNLRALPGRDKDRADRPITRGGPAPLIITTPADINSVRTVTALVKEIKLTDSLAIHALEKISKIAITALTKYKLS